MTVEYAVKCLLAPVAWCIVVPLWTLWFLLAFLFSRRSLPHMWLEFTNILRNSIEEP